MKKAIAARHPIVLILLSAAAGAYWLFVAVGSNPSKSVNVLEPTESAHVPMAPAVSNLSATPRGGQPVPLGRPVESPARLSAGNDSLGGTIASAEPKASPRNSAGESVKAELLDADPSSRISALHRLYGLPAQRSVPLLQQLLLTEKDGVVSEEARAVLRVIGGDDAVTAVTTGLAEPETERRRAVIASLGRVGPAAVSLLGQVLFSESDPALRWLAVEQLSHIATPAAMSLLAQAKNDDDPRVTQAASDALSGWEQHPQDKRSAADEWLNSLYADVDPLPFDLVDDLSSQNEQYVRFDAMQRIHELDEDQAVGVLTHLLQWDEDPAVRTEALFELETYSDEAADQAIAIALGDRSPELRHEALLALWAAENPDRHLVAAQLLQSDPDPALRGEAVRLLREDSDPRARLFLELLLPGSE